MNSLATQVEQLVREYLEQTDYQLQTLEVDGDMNILVEVDRVGVVDLDFCAALNTYLVQRLGDKDDYSLEVGSVSLTAPFKSAIQYHKNLGREIEVLSDGRKTRGTLVSVDDTTFSIETEVMVAVEGKKRRQRQVQTLTYAYDQAVSKAVFKV